MGGGRGRGNHRSRTQRKHFRDGRDNVWKRPKSDSSAADSNTNNAGDNPTWQPFATQNLAFEEYYKEQGIVSPEEWDTFVEVLRKPLPSAFRINSSSQFSADIRMQLENDFRKSLQAEVTDGSEVDPVRPLPWYPDNLAWQSNFSRMQLRKNQTLERFHEFLKLENEIGNITRQEAVSMVPPLFLDVRPDHFVLDMCAAPGSKTFQLLEIIYQSTKSKSLPDGMVVANDLDVQRCNLLIHQTKRMCTANLIVTNNEAQHFPGCRVKVSENDFEPPISQLLFDRILCDVPCSGDGTLRKAPDLWRKWNSGMGNGLHILQIQIAMRGLTLLKVGGRMVYSTCSMNPVENEAVVAEILRKCGESVELVDVSNDCPLLVRRPGLRKWKVRDKGIWLSSHKDVSKYRRYGILPSMFPSGKSYVAPEESDCKHENGDDKTSEDEPMEDPMASMEDSNEEVSDLPLERCTRIVPHDQNSGAFFIAIFHKLSPLPFIPEKPSRRGNLLNKKQDSQQKSSDEVSEVNNGMELNSEDAALQRSAEVPSEAELIDTDLQGSIEVASEAELIENEPDKTCGENESEKAEEVNEEPLPSKPAGKRKLQIQGKWKGVDPVLFFKDEAIINSIKAFYGIDESLPLDGHLISRNIDNNHVKRIYYVSKSVKDVLELNLRVGQQLKIASVGLKMFERQTSREGTSAPCSFRISSEGLPVILPHLTKQILCISPVDFKHLLQYKFVKYTDFVDAESGEKASKLQTGCCVIVLRDGKNLSDPIHVDASTIAIGCWKGRSSLNVMVTAIDCQELLERLSVRMDGEKATREDKVEAGEVQDSMNGVEKVEESESAKQATN